jgi:hypothetical protein
MLPTTQTPVPAPAEVEAVPSSKIEVKEDVPGYGFGPTASPYLAPYAYDSDSLDKQYGLRKDGDEYKFGNSTVTIDEDSNIYLKDKKFKMRGSLGAFDAQEAESRGRNDQGLS